MVRIFGPEPDEITLKHIWDFLAIRKSYFVDGLNWDLCHSEGREWDEYDLPNAYFMVAYEDGACVGGARLLPTDNKLPQRHTQDLTYMLADFVENRIPVGISPHDMTEKLPYDAQIWEMTRFVAQSPKVTMALLQQAYRFLDARSAKEVLTLSPKLMPRVLKRMGFTTRVFSDTLTFDDRDYVAVRTQVKAEPEVHSFELMTPVANPPMRSSPNSR